MTRTDKSLIEAHCKGDKEAFGELVRRHGGSVLGYLTKMCANIEQAEDLFQETFKRVHKNAHTLRTSQFKSWLFTIATRVAIDSLQKRKRLWRLSHGPIMSLNQSNNPLEQDCEETTAAIIDENSVEPSYQVVLSEQKERVRKAVLELPARQRAALVLSYYQQLSYPEVAQALGCSIGTVKTQMYRALRTLAKKLPEYRGDVQ